MNRAIYLSVTLLTFFACKEQNVYILDVNFKNSLIETACIDTNNDGKADSNLDINKDKKIQFSEVQNIEYLNVSSKNIKSLDGIEAFVNLKRLDCYDNELTSLDVSKNKKLEVLYCYDNQLTKLDLTKNKNLKKVGCRGNHLTSLDLSQNSNLEVLYCYENRLTSLNIKNGNNANMTAMSSYNNPNLSCIKVDNEGLNFPDCNKSDYSGWCKDDTTSYSKDCK